MKFGYLHDTNGKNNLSVRAAEENSGSPKIIEAVTWRLAEQLRMERDCFERTSSDFGVKRFRR